MRRRAPVWSGLLLALLVQQAVVGCGRGGDSDGDGAAADPDPTGGTVDPEARDVSGAFFIGDEGTPASGYELWLVDLTAGTTVKRSLDSTGSFSIVIESFVEDHVYAFHLVKDHVLIGSVDLASASGTQAAFVYGGGYGFSIGDVVVAVDDYGRMAVGSAVLSGSLGGGFALQSGESGAFDEFPAPAGVSAASVGSQLVVVDAMTVLHSFYRAETNPSLYARDLASMSRIGVIIAVDEPADWARTYALSGGAWLRTARVASTADAVPAASAYWSESSFNLVPTDEHTFEVALFSGELPSPGSILGLKMQPHSGVQLDVQRAVGTVISQVPVVVAAAADGGAATTIDYASTSGANGLTRPLCQVGDVSFDLSVPLDLAGDPIVGTFDRIDVEIDYYGLAGGKTVLLSTKPEEFSAPFDEAYEGTAAGMPFSWTPGKTRLRFALDSTAQGQSSHSLLVIKELLPAKVGSAAIYRARLRIHYRSSTSAIEAATILWVEKDC